MSAMNTPSASSPRYILVTGAYGGMGRATITALAKRGYKVFALDLKAPCEAQQGIIPIEADVTNEASLGKVMETTDELFAIVHFAGRYVMDSLIEVPAKELEAVFRINVLGAFLVNRTFQPLLKTGSRIVMTTSELAPLDPLPFTGIYAVTKSTLDKYAYSLGLVSCAGHPCNSQILEKTTPFGYH